MAKPHYSGTFNFDKMARLTGITMTGNPEMDVGLFSLAIWLNKLFSIKPIKENTLKETFKPESVKWFGINM